MRHAFAQETGSLVLYAPLSGVFVPITEVPDPTFAQKMVGDGISIDPVSHILLAPCPGEITQVHGSSHALTITTPEGVEVLIHIGLETVILKGRGFTAKVKTGDTVRTGDPLIEFDLDFLARNAASLLTQMVISNGEKVTAYRPSTGMAEAGKTPALELVLQTERQAEGAAGAGGTADGGETLESEPIVILNHAGLHARPTAVLANTAKQFNADVRIRAKGKEVNARSVVGVMGLDIQQHDRIVLTAKGPDAQDALARLVPLIRSGLGENLHAPVPDPRETPPQAAAPERPASGDPGVLLGVSASPGLVVGRVHQLRHAAVAVEEKGRGAETERAALLEALAKSKQELLTLQDDLRRRADAGKAAIFAAHQELLEDPELLEATEQGIGNGQSAAYAWRAAFTVQAETLARLNNELLAGRANDIRDIGRRVLGHLVGAVEGPAEMPKDVVLIAEDLTPSDTAGLDKSRVLGFCTTGGSATSHASILARSAGIPAVAAIERRALDLPDGTLVVLDGDKGELRLEPSPEEMERIRALQEETARVREAALAEAAKPAVTLDGHRIKVVANIGGVAEAEELVPLGGEGVGLLRSEFLFLQRAVAPSEEEQASVYVAVAKALGPERDLVVRTLDVGGDKPLAYLPMPPEENPFLGVRGIRLNLLGTELFSSQIRAVLAAAPHARLHIMFPMVASVEELREARDIVLREKEALGVQAEAAIGIMVEVPSAALLAEGLAREADFFSIGTNDLTQYTLAMDRGHPRLAKMADALHPAVLSLIALTVEGAHKHGKWVGVCGGLASEELAVPVLLGLGIDELSVSVAAIPAIKAAVRRENKESCRVLAREVLGMLTAEEVRAHLTRRQGQ